MGRVRPLDVECVTDPLTMVTAITQYDRQRGDFCAEVGRDTVRAERQSDLIRKLRDELRRGLGLKWARSILVEKAPKPKFLSRASFRDGFFAGASIALARGEIAERADGALLFRAWPHEDFDEELPDGLNPEDKRIVSVLPSFVLHQPYHEMTWRGLLAGALMLERVAIELAGAPDIEAVRKAVDLKAMLKEIERDAQPDITD